MNLDWLKQLDTPYDVLGEQGEIVIVNGDCLKVLAAMPKGCVDAYLTDPPYGIQYQSARRIDTERFNVLCGDDTPQTDWLAYATDGTAMIVFCEWRNAEAFRRSMDAAGWPVKSQLIWDRVVHGLGDLNGAFAPQHDLAWWSSRDGFSFANGRPTTVMRFQRVSADALWHPTEKPEALMVYLVDRASRVGNTICDPFLGSGTTLVACVRTGRRGIGIEIDPGYYQIAKRRILAELAQPRLPFAEQPKAEQAEMFPAAS